MYDIPWSIVQLGARCEYRFVKLAPKNGKRPTIGVVHAFVYAEQASIDETIPQNGVNVPFYLGS